MLEEPVGVTIILFLVIRELLSYLKTQKGTERRKSVGEELEDSLKTNIIPIMSTQVLILNELKELASQGHDSHIKLQLGMEVLKDDNDKVRTNLNNIANFLHSLPPRQV